MKFVKMHGIGNDYVYLDAVSRPELESLNLSDLARRISDRHTGVGSDGLILVCGPTPQGHGASAHVRMRMFNADGSESQMCGNGVRCVAKFAHDRLGITARPMLVQTGRGALEIDYEVGPGGLARATVDMGEPILEPDQIGVDVSRLARDEQDPAWRISLDDGASYAAVFVSMGNPHAVVFCDDPAAVELEHIGPKIERHPAFPQRINVHFIAARGPREAVMRSWERGSGITLACGTGACAVLVVGTLTGRLDREALIHLPGGDLSIRWDEGSGHVFMTGPAEDVFEGEWAETR